MDNLVELRRRIDRNSLFLSVPLYIIRQIFAPDAFLRQVRALVILVILRRSLARLRRVGRSWSRSLKCLVSESARKARDLRDQRKKCKDYETFHRLGEELDVVLGLDKWKLKEDSRLYNKCILKERTQKYKDLMASGNVEECMFALRGELLRKHFGIGNPALFHVATTGTKQIVEDYVSTVCQAMAFVAFSHRDSLRDGPSIVEKLAFFNETKHSFGRTALLLSGGAALGMYHFGVVKALHLNAMLPRIISGTSAGSIIAGCICTRTDDELMKMWADDFDWAHHLNLHFFSKPDFLGFVSRGGAGMYSTSYLGNTLKDSIGGYTFLEAFDRTGRILNIAVSGTPGSSRLPTLLNYLTAPHVLIWSASVVSCSIPGVFESGELLSKDSHGNIVPYVSMGLKWQDGSMQSDLPMTRLTELFNVNFFIVSQVNPQAYFVSGGGIGRPSGLVFRSAMFLRKQLKQWLVSVSQFMSNAAGGRVSPYLRPVGFTPVGLVVQEYEGDITIFNGPGMWALPNLLVNGSNEILRRLTRTSEWETWWYLPQIQNSCAIEFLMDEIMKDLRAEILSEKEPKRTGTRKHSYSLLSQMTDSGDPNDLGLKRMPSFAQNVIDGPRAAGGHNHMQITEPSLRPTGRVKSKQVAGLAGRRSAGLLASSHSLMNLLAVGAENSGTM